MTPSIPIEARLAVRAAADLAERAGAAEFDIGYDRQDPTIWHATATYQGMKFFVDGQPSAEAAANALSHRLLTGAACKCGRTVALRDGAKGCRWRREGPRWVPGCDAPALELPAEERGNLRSLQRAVAELATERPEAS
jgi:hypothetical protein